MDRKYKAPTPTEVIVLIGKNFIVDHLYSNFKRFSKLKTYEFEYVNDINYHADYIIDCSFNEKSQNDILKYAIENDIKKVIIINHWKKFINEFKNLVIVQVVVPDVYGEEHNCFNRPGAGNKYDSPINYCCLISECIRRIHEAKSNFIPNLYIHYGEETIKYMYVENLYQPIQYVLDNIHETSEYEIYDEYKNIGSILDMIKEVLEYKGNIEFINTKSSYSKPIKKLSYKHNYKPFMFTIQNIYRHLIYNNERFMNFY